MRVPLIAAAAAVLLLSLTGCAGATPSTDAKPSATPTETVAPLKAETPTETAPADPEAAFLDAMHTRLKAERPPIEETQIPNASDEQLLEAGKNACAQLASGAGVRDVRVIEGEKANELGYFIDSQDIAKAAEQDLCK